MTTQQPPPQAGWSEIPHGMELLNRPGLNKGTAVTEAERSALGLHGLLPPLSEIRNVAPDGVQKMEAFDDALIARHLSPGGSADLLAVTWFLAQFPTSAASRLPASSFQTLMNAIHSATGKPFSPNTHFELSPTTALTKESLHEHDHH